MKFLHRDHTSILELLGEWFKRHGDDGEYTALSTLNGDESIEPPILRAHRRAKWAPWQTCISVVALISLGLTAGILVTKWYNLKVSTVFDSFQDM
jgi:hypothetical protein